MVYLGGPALKVPATHQRGDRPGVRNQLGGPVHGEIELVQREAQAPAPRISGQVPALARSGPVLWV